MTQPSIVLHLSTPGGFKTFAQMSEAEQQLVNRVHELRSVSSMIGAESPCGALVICRRERIRICVAGTPAEHPAVAALDDARMAGVTSDITLAFSVENNRSRDSIPDEVLEALSDFGPTTVLLVGDDRSIAIATTNEATAA